MSTASRPAKVMDDGDAMLEAILRDGGVAGARTLDLGQSPTVLLVFAANRFTRIWSRYLQTRFDLGAMDWRMMVMLTAEPGSSVSRASQVINIDKGAVSRALARLEAKGLARAESPSSYPHRRTWSLTRAGSALHDEILEIALSRQRQILGGFTVEDVGQLNGYLRRILDNLGGLESPGDRNGDDAPV